MAASSCRSLDCVRHHTITLATPGERVLSINGEDMTASAAYSRLSIVAHPEVPMIYLDEGPPVYLDGQRFSGGRAESSESGREFHGGTVRYWDSPIPGDRSASILHELGTHEARAAAEIGHGHRAPRHERASGSPTDPHNEVDLEVHHWTSVVQRGFESRSGAGGGPSRHDSLFPAREDPGRPSERDAFRTEPRRL